MNHKKVEVYTATSFSDLLSSPVFYSTAAIAFVLGVFSILGFLQSPAKLKTTVDMIAKKVIVLELKEPTSTVVAVNNSVELNKTPVSNRNRYSSLSNKLLEKSIAGVKPVSFDYDITSKHFWDNLDTKTMPGVVKIEDSAKIKNDSLLFGTPVESDFLENNDDARYSLKLKSGFKI